VLAASLTGCGGGTSSRPQPEASTTTAAAQTRTQAQPADSGPPRWDLVHGVAPNPWKEPAPRLRPHPHFKLDHVVVRELKKGHGPAVRMYDTVYIDYIEANYRRAIKYYKAWGKGHFGTAGVILIPVGRWRGLIAGMKGMRPGARRQILAPQRLGGVDARHLEYSVIYRDVVLRKILAHGCFADGVPCRSIAP